MEFRVLGPVEVHNGFGLVDLGPPKQRALIAKLLQHPNQVVSASQLIETLWADAPPETAPAILHTYVCRLRHALRTDGDGGTADEVLRTRPPGYLLRVQPGQLDLDRFQALVRSAGAAAVRRDHETAARLLRSALALWRGEALANIASNELRRGEAVRLEECRLAAVEARIEAELCLGKHRDLVGELSTLVADHPSRERLHGQLMFALYRSGRQADALACYTRLRRTLADELGLEPGPELQRLHRAILQADPSLDLHQSVQPATVTAGSVAKATGQDQSSGEAAYPPAVRPCQLPADTAAFTGREHELATIERLLVQGAPDRPPAIVAIDGLPGVGKSALATRVAHRLAAHFPDGQLYVDLHGATGFAPLRPSDVLGRFLRSFGIEGRHLPTEPEERAGLLRSLLAQRRVLAVLDNAASAEQVRLLLPAGPGCAALITSRRNMADLDGVTHLHLDLLGIDDATALLGRLVGPHRVVMEHRAAAQVAQLCGRLPLALRIAGARLAARPAWSVGTLAERLRDEHRRLDELELDGLALRASLQVAYRELRDRGADGDEGARAFRLLSLLDGTDVGIKIAAAVLDRPIRTAEATLERLVDMNLLECAAPRRYRYHDLVRLFAREYAASEDTQAERAAALARALDSYLNTVQHADLLLRPGQTASHEPAVASGELRDHAEAINWLETERANLVAAVGRAAGSQPTLAWQLANALFGFYDLRGSWDEWEQVNTIALQAARSSSDLPGQAHTLRALGAIAWRRFRLNDARGYLEESRRLFREIGDSHGEARTLNSLGLVFTACRRYDDASAQLERSLELFRSRGDRRGEGNVANNLGDLRRLQGRHDEALTYLRHDLSICRELDDRRGTAITLCNLGEMERDRGRAAEALDYHAESLRICRELGDRRGEGLNLDGLGEARRLQGDNRTAVKLLRQSVALLSEARDQYAEADALWHLGLALDALHDSAEAATHKQRALDIFQQLGAPEADDVRASLRGSDLGVASRH
jgi:DNA-binding SARP family transcriptional activator/tetratricopeptide (TPR) repeat protein